MNKQKTLPVGFDCEFLHGYTSDGSEAPHESRAHAIGRVALVGVVLHHQSAVQTRLVLNNQPKE